MLGIHDESQEVVRSITCHRRVRSRGKHASDKPNYLDPKSQDLEESSLGNSVSLGCRVIHKSVPITHSPE